MTQYSRGSSFQVSTAEQSRPSFASRLVCDQTDLPSLLFELSSTNSLTRHTAHQQWLAAAATAAAATKTSPLQLALGSSRMPTSPTQTRCCCRWTPHTATSITATAYCCLCLQLLASRAATERSAAAACSLGAACLGALVLPQCSLSALGLGEIHAGLGVCCIREPVIQARASPMDV